MAATWKGALFEWITQGAGPCTEGSTCLSMFKNILADGMSKRGAINLNAGLSAERTQEVPGDDVALNF